MFCACDQSFCPLAAPVVHRADCWHALAYGAPHRHHLSRRYSASAVLSSTHPSMASHVQEYFIPVKTQCNIYPQHTNISHQTHTKCTYVIPPTTTKLSVQTELNAHKEISALKQLKVQFFPTTHPCPNRVNAAF